MWRLLIWLYRRKGFTLEGGPPDLPKFIIAGAPHTSNWDFVFFAGAVHQMGIHPSFIGKHTLFRWPLTRFMYDMGGMPINRGAPQGYVKSVIEAIAAAKTIALVIAPEGTRSSGGRWKSGFWHIAHGAGVPIVPAWIDQRTRRGGLGAPIWTTGDFAADLATIHAFFQSKIPDCPRLEVLAAQLAELAATDQG